MSDLNRLEDETHDEAHDVDQRAASRATRGTFDRIPQLTDTRPTRP